MTGKEFYNSSILPYAGIIIKICRAYTNNKEEFEDYYQEVCLQIWRSREKFLGLSEWSTWVYRISLNVCLTNIKKKPTKETIEDENLICDRINADETMENEQDLSRLYAAIRQLKEMDRAIILLYLEEKSYQQIAEILGLSATNIGVRINRIKEKLTKIISDQG
ncbi:sigma-70 family RNA polymerase sigma factor [Temperatibacter marinus]|uniref:Sigma-70 family RNA polymerase sigma factor n=1 Tax=Temperatibacter marinus TaxID=1456591 RepID=A0AA52HB16_9PROT|nr:sigma-70 family RNA polymerase sigma factor [Temperatibacter marinus]WND03305.1 sigma-70 family RNA polymerase sigma factor [Temperatibacter marinus]